MVCALIFYHANLDTWDGTGAESLSIDWVDGFPSIKSEESLSMSS